MKVAVLPARAGRILALVAIAAGFAACTTLVGVDPDEYHAICEAGARDCDGNTPRACGPSGAWQVGEACSGQTCVAGVCSGKCAPADARCNGQTPEICGPDGQWDALEPCPDMCVDGACTDGGAPPAGACANADDMALIQSPQAMIQSKASNCQKTNLAMEPGTLNCIKMLGLTDECAGCYDDFVQCVAKQCITCVADPSGSTCLDCRASSCDPAFTDCSGFAPM